jgi:dTDP-4-amino-4,6-dideoxygalactose transaminase
MNQDNPHDKSGGRHEFIPFKTIPRRRPHFPESVISALIESFRGDIYSSQRETKDLETALHDKLGIMNPTVTASGRIGLRLLLETSGLHSGAEILVPGYTFGLIYPAIKASGFIPVPVDIAPHSFQMDPAKAEAAVTKRTGAILATHLFGEPCEIESFVEIAAKNKLLLIEDCAQALGASRGKNSAGSFGDAAISSFDISKPLHGIRGGLAFGKDSEWITKVREKVISLPARGGNALPEIISGYAQTAFVGSPLWRGPMILFSHKHTRDLLVRLYRKSEVSENAPGIKTIIDEVGLPGQLARIIRLNLESLASRLERRREIRVIYRELLGDILDFQSNFPADKGTCHMVVATVKADIASLRRFLALRGIDIAAGDEIADDCLRVPGSVTDAIFKSAISLPIYSSLCDDDVRLVSDYIRVGYNKCRTN